jgi:flagellar biosynthesis anti-sigma factor FlgM
VKKLWARLKFPNRPPILQLQGNSGEETKMRIDPNQAAQTLLESGRTSNASPASDGNRPAASNPLGEDQAQLSGAHIQVQFLATQVLQFPEIRQEKVNALRQVVLGGSYQPSSNQVADAVFAHILAIPAA